MAVFPAGACLGSSTWKVDPGSGRWFPTGSNALTPGCVVATQFQFQGTMIDAATGGLSHDAFRAMKAKFGGAILFANGEFQIPLVPAGSPPIDLD